jgi:hypothetical protein
MFPRGFKAASIHPKVTGALARRRRYPTIYLTLSFASAPVAVCAFGREIDHLLLWG